MSDLNSNVPVTIAPQNIQAIITGSGDNFGEIKYIRKGISEEFSKKSIIYTSGTGAIFKSGIPIGKLKFDRKKPYVEFYSDFSQLKYVFAEVLTKKDIIVSNNEESSNIENENPMDAKLKILEDEKKIIEDSNLKFKEENENLKSQINNLNYELLEFEKQTLSQKKIIEQFNIDKEELKFLRLNLEHGHKCRKTFMNSKGFIVGTSDYKNCVLSKE